eukprot:TRINITY_DN52341_c0_g1_i1.p1 TRINITY_DN52341_c0_g1~~TRINITY_DN52341_c0_g1_i1.p1  ORF type:complete len:245 (+),score=65.25 TRINITY_DN52341_c0_g1_i1:98-736(+)
MDAAALEQWPPYLQVSGPGRAEGLDWRALDGRYIRTTEDEVGRPKYRHERTRVELSYVVLYDDFATGVRRWRFAVPLTPNIVDAGDPPAQMPQDVAQWKVGGQELSLCVSLPPQEVVRVGAQLLLDCQLDTPLSELGLSAECAVELLRVPEAARQLPAAEEGPFTVFVSAPALGCPDATALELSPGTTLGGLMSLCCARLPLRSGAAAAAPR